MATIEPLRAVRYATQPGARDISSRIAPPYDVLDIADKDALLARDERNFVTIDLPHMPPKTAGPPSAYEAAARRMTEWLTDGILMRDPQPAVYPYYQRYKHAGVQYSRKKFFVRLRLEEFGTGHVFPHEHTFGGPKEDRLLLTKATKANLSPIFGLFEDAAGEIAIAIDAALPGEPVAVGTLDGVESRLWAITDTAVIDTITRGMSDKAVFIADGHHRYGTSLLYREWLTQQMGPLPADHPANFVLCVLCAMEDPGLLILPTHRALPGKPIPLSVLQGDGHLEVLPLSSATRDIAMTRLHAYGPQAIAFFDGTQNEFAVIRPRQPDVLRDYEPDRSPAWRTLALSLLHAYLLDRLLTPKVFGGAPPEIHYVKSAQAAEDEARQTRGSAFLLQPTTMAELRGVCKAGDLMPQKSTYFFPKLASGMLINPLE